MKKLVSVLLVTVMLFTLLPVSAAGTLNVGFDITCNGDEEITVPTGTVITVSFAIENKAGEEFSLNNLQNEIYFDDNFFEFVDGSATVVKSGRTHSCSLKEYSDGEKRVYVNSIRTTDYKAKETIATFKLKVVETRIGAKSKIVSKLPGAQNINGEAANIERKDLSVIVGKEDTTIKKYDVKYYDDTKLLYTDSEILSGSKTNLRSAPTKTGYTFVGWEIDGKVYNAGSEYTVKAHTTVKAKWEAKKKYILSFDTKGGSYVAPVTGYEGDTISITQRPTRTRYTFDGWYLNESCTQRAGSTIKLKSDVIIYAKWSITTTSGGGGGGGGGGGASTAQKYVITFKTTDDVVLGTYERVSGVIFDLTKQSYEKGGHTFEGWYSDKELTKKVTSIKVTEDATFYAKWVEGKSDKEETKPDYHPDILRNDHCAYIVGRSANRICPKDNITRAEVATIFFRLLTDDVRSTNISKTNAFDDVKDSSWYNTAVSTLAYLGIINGRNETTFAPEAYITRAEFTTIAARFSDVVYNGGDLFGDISGHWAKGYINSAASIGWVNGDNGKFRPDDNITRAEVMTLVNRVLNRQPESREDLLDDMTKWEDNSDENAWFYIAVQEATNSHNFEMKADGIHEKWTELTETEVNPKV